MSNVEQKLQAMGLKLPACPAPVAAYLPVQTAGNLIYASGQTAWVDGKLLYAGKVGGDVSIADAYESAKISAVNCLSAIATVADLDRIRIVRVHGWVNGVPDFGDQPAVVNGASELLEALYGEHGRHARSAIGRGLSAHERLGRDRDHRRKALNRHDTPKTTSKHRKMM